MTDKSSSTEMEKTDMVGKEVIDDKPINVQLSELSTTVSSVKAQMDALKLQLDTITTAVDPLGEKVDNVLKTNVAIGKTVASIKKTTETHSNKQSELEQLMSDLNKSITSAQEYIETVQTKQMTNIANIESLNKEKEQIRKELIAHMTKVNETAEKVRTVMEEVGTVACKAENFDTLTKNAVRICVGCVLFVSGIVVSEWFGIFKLIGRFFNWIIS